jgi:hypothetical protein
MARTFNGSNQGMRSTSMATLSKPFSMSCWANSNSATANQMAFSVGDASGSHYYGVEFRGGNGGDPVRAKEYNGSTTATAGTQGYSTGVWHNVVAIFVAADDRQCYMDGYYEGNVASVTTNAPDAVAIGVSGDNTPFGYFDGSVAECAIWNIEIDATDVAMLGAGYSPLFVRPEALVFYAPAVRGNVDRIGGLALTESNSPTVSAHIPIIYKPPPFVVAVPGAGAPPVSGALPGRRMPRGIGRGILRGAL